MTILGRSEELVSRCVECDLAEPESLASLGGSAPGVVDGILSELVAVDDCMSLILWTRYFLEAQGYGVDDAIIYQDNKSTILLEQNGRASSTRRTRHLNI